MPLSRRSPDELLQLPGQFLGAVADPIAQALWGRTRLIRVQFERRPEDERMGPSIVAVI